MELGRYVLISQVTPIFLSFIKFFISNKIAMALFDGLSLISYSIARIGLGYWIKEMELLNPATIPISNIAYTVSIYLTLLVTIERYFAIYWTDKSSKLCSEKKTKVCIILIFLFSTVRNFPSFFVCTFLSL